MISQLARLAMQELVRLVRVNEPFWINFSNSYQAERYNLDRKSYNQFISKNSHIRGDYVSEESSKYSGRVGLDGTELPELFLDSLSMQLFLDRLILKHFNQFHAINPNYYVIL
jgi:homeobox-leucine zipper protein